MRRKILYNILNEWRDEDMDDSPIDIDLDDDMNIEHGSSDMDNEPDLDDDDFALSTTFHKKSYIIKYLYNIYTFNNKYQGNVFLHRSYDLPQEDNPLVLVYNRELVTTQKNITGIYGQYEPLDVIPIDDNIFNECINLLQRKYLVVKDSTYTDKWFITYCGDIEYYFHTRAGFTKSYPHENNYIFDYDELYDYLLELDNISYKDEKYPIFNKNHIIINNSTVERNIKEYPIILLRIAYVDDIFDMNELNKLNPKISKYRFRLRGDNSPTECLCPLNDSKGLRSDKVSINVINHIVLYYNPSQKKRVKLNSMHCIAPGWNILCDTDYTDEKMIYGIKDIRTILKRRT